MRIVDEPTSYSWQQNLQSVENTLATRVDPSPFSGPEHLKTLNKKCFTKTIEKYEYKFCPFANVTQKEVGMNTWNPYRGVVGVWQEWKIKDNQFTSMMMLMGDQCGDKPRQAEVKLRCGAEAEVLNVTEPVHCEYELTFSTPLVCHNHSLLVYPTLSANHRSQWNRLYSEFKANEITDKGYHKGLTALFQAAGYMLRSSATSGKDSTILKDPAAGDLTTSTKFSDLQTCNDAYGLLKKELEETKAKLPTET